MRNYIKLIVLLVILGACTKEDIAVQDTNIPDPSLPWYSLTNRNAIDTIKLLHVEERSSDNQLIDQYIDSVYYSSTIYDYPDVMRLKKFTVFDPDRHLFFYMKWYAPAGKPGQSIYKSFNVDWESKIYTEWTQIFNIHKILQADGSYFFKDSVRVSSINIQGLILKD